MTTGRGVAGAGGAAGLRAAGFLLAAGLCRAAFFFPARLFAFAIRSSSQVTPRGRPADPQCMCAKVLLARSRYSTSGSSLMPPAHITAFDTGSIATRAKVSSSEMAW
jgi:hypothetical protein